KASTCHCTQVLLAGSSIAGRARFTDVRGILRAPGEAVLDSAGPGSHLLGSESSPRVCDAGIRRFEQCRLHRDHRRDWLGKTQARGISAPEARRVDHCRTDFEYAAGARRVITVDHDVARTTVRGILHGTLRAISGVSPGTVRRTPPYGLDH